ncbi:MAG TPA: hypothetical protein DD706_19055 [Nitrospiraceae bacterium]|nr:hypothetical protein [Nitrospiraceae bacterium]
MCDLYLGGVRWLRQVPRGGDLRVVRKSKFSLPFTQAKKSYKVDVKDSKIEQTLEVPSSFTDAVDGNFIDSAQAITEGKKKGLKGKNRAMMTLLVMLQGTKSQDAYWNIVSDHADGRSTLINAKTGKIFRHQPLK